MSVRSAWLLPGGAEPGQTREDTRLSPLGTMTPTGPLTTRPGVIPGGAPFAASGAGAMSLQVGTGRAVAQGTTAQGAYPLALDAPVVVDFDDGDALSDRIDTVVIRAFDGLYDLSGQTLARVEIVKGEPSATPAAATLDPACVALWGVLVPAGTSAGVGGIDWGTALTDRRRYTVAVGGITPPGDTAAAGAYVGQWRDNGGILERWDGSTWVVRSPHAGSTYDADLALSAGRQVRIGAHRALTGLTGEVTVSFTNVTSRTVPVTFAAPFTTRPTVTTNISSGAGETSRWSSRAISVGTAGFTLFVYSGESGGTGTWAGTVVQWAAVSQ